MSVAAIVETGTLLKVVLISLVAGCGVAILFGIAVAGGSSLADAIRAGRRRPAAAWAVVACLGAAGSVAAIVMALLVMTAKR